MTFIYQVCDEPHPTMIKSMLDHCVQGDIDKAFEIMNHMWKMGYSPEDIIGNIFKNCKTHTMPEYLKLEYVKVSIHPDYSECNHIFRDSRDAEKV